MSRIAKWTKPIMRKCPICKKVKTLSEFRTTTRKMFQIGVQFPCHECQVRRSTESRRWIQESPYKIVREEITRPRHRPEATK